MSNKILFIFTLFFQLFCSSCIEPGIIFNQKINIKNNTWETNQVPEFAWTVNDSSSLYNLVLTIEHHPDLNFRNLYVKCKTTFPDSSTKDQILSLEIFEEKGKPFGNCSNSKCKTEIMLQNNIRFPLIGDYHLAIEQYSREKMLSGINSLNLKIINLEKS